MAASSTFGAVVDYFGLEAESEGSLVAEWSDDGLAHSVTVEHNGNDGDATGKSPPPYWITKAMRSPSVRYRVVGSISLSVVIGKGFAASESGEASGYMIATVRIYTRIGEATSVTVTGVPNEGVNAARTYIFTTSLSPRHRPQDALGSISTGGGDLIEMAFGFSCDPVVTYDHNLPTASDITHGRIEATATIADYDGTASPDAGIGFSLVGSPVVTTGTDYKSYTVNVAKEVF